MNHFTRLLLMLMVLPGVVCAQVSEPITSQKIVFKRESTGTIINQYDTKIYDDGILVMEVNSGFRTMAYWVPSDKGLRINAVMRARLTETTSIQFTLSDRVSDIPTQKKAKTERYLGLISLRIKF